MSQPIRRMIMARLLNLILFILEIRALRVSRTGIKLKNYIYYTRISNALAAISALLLVIFGQKPFVEVLRLMSTSMLFMTFFVTAFILVPITKQFTNLMLASSGLFNHLLCPILSLVSYMAFENKAPFGWVLLPIAVTLIYGLTMVYFNAKGTIEGPYPFFMVKRFGKKFVAIWMVCLIVVTTAISAFVGYTSPKKTDLKYVYVHGLAGWGSYDARYEFIPYWGLTGGDLIRYMNKQGYDSYAASVDPIGSAWDRACELYAQLTGTVVDYGEEHSKRCNHERFGEDYSKKPLLKDFEESRIVLIGHSFGGATIRLFSEILKNGSEAERNATDEAELSQFFKGGNGDNLYALVTFAAPTNGTTAYDLYEDDSFDLEAIKIPEEYEKNSDAVSKGTKAILDGRIADDYASYDMHIDNALALNETITTFSDVYYFSVPCSSTETKADGTVEPNPDITENIFMKGAIYMSKYSGTTKGGFVLDESWQSNDGLVNEISARAPFNATSRDYEFGEETTPGIWNVLPTFKGDHMSLQGGLTHRIDVKQFYLDMAETIANLD